MKLIRSNDRFNYPKSVLVFKQKYPSRKENISYTTLVFIYSFFYINLAFFYNHVQIMFVSIKNMLCITILFVTKRGMPCIMCIFVSNIGKLCKNKSLTFQVLYTMKKLIIGIMRERGADQTAAIAFNHPLKVKCAFCGFYISVLTIEIMAIWGTVVHILSSLWIKQRYLHICTCLLRVQS